MLILLAVFIVLQAMALFVWAPFRSQHRLLVAGLSLIVVGVIKLHQKRKKKS